jgi:hypothetical protein
MGGKSFTQSVLNAAWSGRLTGDVVGSLYRFPPHPTPKVLVVGFAGRLSKKTPNLLSFLPESLEEITDPASGSVMLKTTGHKIYRFYDSISGGILFWGSVLLIAVLCVAGVAGYAASYLIPLEAMALVILIFIVIEYWRSRL